MQRTLENYRINDDSNLKEPYPYNWIMWKYIKLKARSSYLSTDKRRVLNMPKAIVKEVINISTGDYKGTIEKNEIVNRGSGGETFQYHVTHLKLDIEGNPVLEKGVPFSITENTLLGQCLKSFGADLVKLAKEGKEIDTDDYLKVGSKVTVSVVRKEIQAKTGGGTFEVSNVDHFTPAK